MGTHVHLVYSITVDTDLATGHARGDPLCFLQVFRVRRTRYQLLE
jgi:hypothetical protein